jgi:uncharacterized protein (DUF58 family)
MTTSIQPTSTAPAGHAASSLLNPRYLAAVSKMELVAKQVMDGYVSGLHKSPHIGFALDFAQHRQYVPGDDIKRIDWRVFAKADRYYIKQYEVTTNLRAFIALDASGSMKYQGHTAPLSKFRYGQYIAACLTYLILHQQDSCGLITFDTKIREFLPARSASAHLLTITRALDATLPAGESAIAPQLHEIAERIGSRSMVIVISDFFDDAAALIQSLHHLRHKRHEVLLLQIMAEEELTFPFRKFSEFESLEVANSRVKLDPAIVRASYLQSVQTHLKRIRDACNDLRISHILMRTSQPLDDALTKYLASRMGSR